MISIPGRFPPARRGTNMMLVTKALPQDVALLAFVPKSQASVLLSLRFRRKINFAVPAGSFACDCRLRFRHRENLVAKGVADS